MKDYSGGWLITITANHSNYLVCDRANTQSITVRKVVETTSITAMLPVIKWITISSCSEEERGCSFFITFNWCICSLSDVKSPTAGFNDPGWEIPGPFLLKSDVNLFNHLVRKADVMVVVLRVLFFVDMRLPRIQCRWFVLSEVVFTLSWCRSINTIPAS